MKTRLFAIPLFVLCFVAGNAFAQFSPPSATANVNLSLIGPESLSVVCTPGTVNFAANPGTTVAGDNPLSCVTTWALAPTRTSLTVYAGFATTTALSDGTGNIPTSAVSVSYNGGAATPCNGAGTGASNITNYCGGGITGLLTTNFTSTHTDSISISVDEPAQLDAATYTGVFIIQGVAL